MSLDLGKRQRAMLREMGVRIWQPMPVDLPPVAPACATPLAVLAGLAPLSATATATTPTNPPAMPIAIDLIAGRARDTDAAGTFSSQSEAIDRPAAGAAQASGRPGAQAFWQLGEALPLYAGSTTAAGPRWLVLAEAPAAALQAGVFNPFEGDVGKLLDNMLRAARLHIAGAVLLAPLVRHAQAPAASTRFDEALPGLIKGARPDVVLVMGRLAGQAVLRSGEPFGKLRGQVHLLHGIRTVVTHDAAYLLRTQSDKARAWDDLCLAMRMAATPFP